VSFRDAASLTVTSDHRAVYGADAARFLGRVKELLEHPLALLL
jgi:pyruvate dehydrogenase E2 component (dihydrolipoamide acetyltransferase)